jgi:chromosome segregation protein
VKLKSLEIQGFKSFDDKTVLNFDDSITAVVGPNGCGKSNIVDSIRWVMGEQSAKHLRGKTMEDIIFAGSDSRTANTLASVELTFETTGQCPPQFADLDEISVGRKLYRTGESEYFVNKQPSRLKDITDLFLGTGVGTKAYSIIEQGRIGQIITAKPEDRRGIIEEVAGISKFKQRKEAAQRRMESTQQNLFRLNDILTEMERQLSSLERQAKKAQRFKVIKDELKDLDLNLASLEYQKLYLAQQDCLQLIKDQDGKELDLNNKMVESDANLEEERVKLSELEIELGVLQQQVYEWENSLKLAESKVANKKEELKRCEFGASETARSIEELNDNFIGAANGLTQVNEKMLFADLDCTQQEQSVLALEEELKSLQGSTQTLFASLEEARDQYNETSNKLSQISTKTEGLKERLTELKEKKEKDDLELQELTTKYEKIDKTLKEAKTDLSDVKQLKFSLGERTDVLQSELVKEQERITVEQSELSTTKEELLKNKSRLESLLELQRNFEGYQEGTRSILKRKKSGELKMALESIAEVVETNSDFENAVSAVLGEKMQYVVVPTQSAGIECAEYLKTASAGRSSFIPLNILSAEPQEEQQGNYNVYSEEYLTERSVSSADDSMLLSEAAVKGKLKDFVNLKSGYESLSELLFGEVVVVDSLQNALNLWGKYKKSLVTFDGEFIAEDGTLTGGTLETTSKALLEKKREIKSLEQSIGELVDQVKAKEEICFDIKRKITELSTEIEEVKTNSHQEEVRMASQEKEILHLSNEVEGLNNRRGQLSQEIFQTSQTIEEIEEQLSSLVAEEIENQSIYDAAHALLTNKKGEEEQSREKLNDLQEELTRQKIQFAQTKEQKVFLTQEIERLIQDEVRLRRQIIWQEEQLVLFTKKKIFLEDRILFHETNIERVLVKKDKIDSDHLEKKNAFETLNAKLRDQEIQLKDIRHQHEEIKDDINKKTIELTEVRASLSHISEQALERYRVMLSEVYQENLPNLDEFDFDESLERASELRKRMSNIGNVNIEAIDELNELKERYEFLDTQRVDLEKSLSALDRAIQKINKTTRVRFKESFELVNEKFTTLFPRLFKGGQAHLKLTDPDNILDTGVDIIAQPPGKKLQSISLLSGGEQALTAVSLLFAIFLIKPAPFCLLDEVDAPLDDANVDRYNDIVKEMAQRTQFIVITHNKRTMQITNHLYGVTMQEPGVSSLVSVLLEQELAQPVN